jgi:PPIC-type PPIASE domain
LSFRCGPERGPSQRATECQASRPTHLKRPALPIPSCSRTTTPNDLRNRSPKSSARLSRRLCFNLKRGAWSGPIQSGYGWHLVFVDAIEPSRVPAFEEVEPDVKSAWLDQKQREIKRIALEAMRARYTVVVPPIESVDLSSLRNRQSPIAATSVLPQ